MRIQEVLKISYDGLDDEQKNIFLDIACFFNLENEDFVTNFLDTSGFFSKIGLSILVNKSLITIEANMIKMHDLLLVMGREIVRQESKDPGKRSRLWHQKDIHNVLTKNTGTEAIESISLDMSKIREIQVDPYVFSKMHRLRLFKLYTSCYKDYENKVHVFQDLKFVFAEIRYFHWQGCPLKTVSSNLVPENLVRLEMRHSNLEELWTGAHHLVKLKHIDLSWSLQLIRCPDLSVTTNLESLILSGCESLLEIPTTSHLQSLREVDLSWCSNLKTLPAFSSNIDTLRLGGTKIEELPSSIECLSRLVKLTFLDLCDAGIIMLPDSLGQLSSLRELYLSRNNFQSIPISIIHLSNLFLLVMSYCERLQSLPELPRNLWMIEARWCTSLGTLPDLTSLFTYTNYQKLFNFSNCFRLDQNVFTNITEDALQKIQLAATSCQDDELMCYGPRGLICFAGSDIPEWFGYQRWGSEINVELPPNWDNRNFIGFALSTVLSIHAPDQDSDMWNSKIDSGFVGCECRLKQKNGEWIVGSNNLMTVTMFNFILDSEDYVMMGYNFFMFGHDFTGSIYSNKASFKFYIGDPRGFHKVKKCGVHLMYAQDVENEGRTRS